MARGEGRNKKKKDWNAENLKDASCQKLVLLNHLVLVAETSC